MVIHVRLASAATVFVCVQTQLINQTPLFCSSRCLLLRVRAGAYCGTVLLGACDPQALPPAAEGAEPCIVVSWDELAIVLKKAKKGQYGCWELYADGHGPSKARTRNPVFCYLRNITKRTGKPAGPIFRLRVGLLHACVWEIAKWVVVDVDGKKMSVAVRPKMHSIVVLPPQ